MGWGPGQEGLMKESREDVGNIPLLSEPVVVPEPEFTVKQEWVEQCKKGKLPLKKRYQLKFSETIRLKREVQSLKKQVSWLKRKVKVYKWRSIKPKVEVSTAATQTGPIEELFEGRAF